MSFPNFRVGFGYDVHQLKDKHPFFLGGVKIPHKSGTFGHSDADVLLHAICDALLGAANLRDIGYHFSNTDSQWKNISSLVLLSKTNTLLKKHRWKIGNIDNTLCLEKPKIQQLIPQMQANIARVLDINNSQISIKATTNEMLGFVGREEGVASYSVCNLFRID